MWSNLLSSGEAARERLTSALKETNEALSQRASAHAQKVKSQSKNNSAATSPSASSSAEEIATDSNSNASNSNSNSNSNINDKTKNPFNFDQEKQNELFDSFKTGWGNVIEVTKNAVETTRDVVEKEQTRIQASLFANGPYVRGTIPYEIIRHDTSVLVLSCQYSVVNT